MIDVGDQMLKFTRSLEEGPLVDIQCRSDFYTRWRIHGRNTRLYSGVRVEVRDLVLVDLLTRSPGE